MADDAIAKDNCCACWKIFALCFLALYITLFKFKTPLQFYVKFATYSIISMTYSLVIIPFLFIRPNNCKNIEWVSMTLGNLLNIFGVSFEIENEKYLQITQPYILLVNHQSSIDFITMMNPKIWPGGFCTPLAKKEILYSGPFGLANWLCGITFIDRLHPEKSRKTIEDLAKRINEENLRIWIYPEGTRNAKTELLPFKKGAFHLAVKAQVPIVCMVTSSYLNFYSKAERKFNTGGKVKVRVLPPFQTKGLNADSVNQLTKHLREKMQKEFDLLNEEIGLDKKYLSDKSVESESSQKQEDFLHVNETEVECLDSILENAYEESLKECLNDDNNNSINEEDTKKFK